jgi:hypothetical protein
MRAILALATVGLLFAPGCGDSSTPADMNMPVIDMAAGGGDMGMETCAGILACATGCLQKMDIQGCVTTCVSKAPMAAQATFLPLEQCIFTYCGLDASAGEIQTCVGTAIADSTKCKSKYAMCM